MIKIAKNGMRIQLDENTLAFSFQKEGGREWRWNEDYAPYMECAEGIVFFRDASEISHETFRLGTGDGILSTYRGFEKDGKLVSYEFQTLVWVEDATGDVRCEWIPLQEEGLDVKKVFWPGPMEFAEKRKDWYTLLTQQQGMLIPNTWETELQKPVFDGFFGTAGAYMPWFAQVREREGYLAVCVTPWNAGYQAEHPAGGPYTRVSVRFEPSLGKMRERRVLKYTFFNDCDYNDICKAYRNEVDEQGRLRTLEEKAVRNPKVNDLIGCAFLHKGIKTFVQPNSDFYDPENPEKNNHLTTFAQREQEIRQLHRMGVKKLYLHLDGWAEPGYDNCHPDYGYGPACEAAGGWEGMKSLADAMHECGYLFGILIFGRGFLHMYLEGILPVYYLGLTLNVFCVAFMTILVFHPVMAEDMLLKGMDLLERMRLMKRKEARRQKLKDSMEVYRETAAYLKEHKKVLFHVIVLTFLQRIALFSVTWFVYLAFRMHGTSLLDVILLQAVISVAVDMLPLPGGMGISETLFLNIFATVFPGVLLPAMVLSRGLGYYSQLLISALFTVVAQIYYSINTNEEDGL